MYKRWVSVLLILVFIFALSGCSLFTDETAKKAVPSDTKLLEEITEGKADSTLTKEDEDELELKHLKNAKPAVEQKNAAPTDQTATNSMTAASQESQDTPTNQVSPSASTEYRPDYRIHFLSEDEARLINEKLMKMGYLKAPAKDDREFADAVYHFQQAEKIPGSGDINPETFEHLRNK